LITAYRTTTAKSERDREKKKEARKRKRKEKKTPTHVALTKAELAARRKGLSPLFLVLASIVRPSAFSLLHFDDL